jgi:DNA-binding phage protein
MAFRTESWDKEIAYQLQHDKAYAHHFVEKLIRAGEDPLEVLRRVVRAYGVKELADKTSLRPQSIVRVLRAPEKAKEETLNKMIRPFGMKVHRKLAFV